MTRQRAYPLAVMLLAFLFSSFSHAESRQVVDVLGRSVTAPLPAKRVILGFNFEDYIAVGGDSAFDSVVGISRGAWEKKVPLNWQLHVAHRPALDRLADVGEVETQSFSVEKVLSLNPDLVVLTAWQFEGLPDEVVRLEKAGVPVLVIDYNAQTLERHVASTLLLGAVTGQEARARELADLYTTAVKDVEKRIADAHKPKPRIYLEFGNKGPAEYSFTYGKNMWGALATAAGGDNIAAPFVEWWGPINPEQVLVARPEVIVISGREDNSNPTALSMGPGVKAETARQQLQAFASRPGWAQLPAIHDGRLYGVYQGASRSLGDFAMLQFIAKQLYPELFADLDPVANYLNYHRTYLPVAAEGTYAIGLND
ncbi:iron ABC transporter substrate-binding protein [Pseudomonas fulva]|uniref:Iron ABC transporter substrate-binding protein n=1 Tax=Pseudomonas fulva TaxID=47880 RepID=A0A0D0KIK8_9PSED|nr:iron ABC transporter substrate-binding protein [Pseudomonas fulva]